MRSPNLWRTLGLAAVVLLALGGWIRQAYGAGNAHPRSLAAASAASAAQAAAASGLHVAGNQLADASGHPVQLQGVMLSQLEFTCQDNDGEYQASSYPALRAWHVNAVKIPINPNYWDGQGCNAASYRAQVYSAVDTALGQGMYVMVSLLAFEPGQGDKTSGQTSLDTWQAVGAHYAGDQRVIYETFSEMHDIPDSEWQTNTQALINVLNTYAPNSVVMANSDSWGGTIGNLWSAGYRVTGKNLGFTIHLYDNGGNANAGNWPASFANLAQQYPMVAAEFGSNTGTCGVGFLKQLMPYMAQHISGWFAWEWNPDSGDYCGRPALLVQGSGSLATGQPSSYGQPIHDWYVSNGLGLDSAPGPAPTATPVPPSPAPTATPIPVTPPTATPTPQPTATPIPVTPPTATPTPQPTATPTNAPTATPISPAPTATPPYAAEQPVVAGTEPTVLPPFGPPARPTPPAQPTTGTPPAHFACASYLLESLGAWLERTASGHVDPCLRIIWPGYFLPFP